MSVYLQAALLVSLLTMTTAAVLLWTRRRVRWVPYFGFVAVLLLFAADGVGRYGHKETQVSTADMKFARAVELLKSGDPAQAKQEFVSARTLGADRLLCLDMIAQCELALKDYASVIETCKTLQNAGGGEAIAHAHRGRAYELQGDLKGALAEYKASEKLGNHVASVSIARLTRKSQ